MRVRQMAVPALEALARSVEVPVAGPAAALPVQTAVDPPVPAAILAAASVAAQAADQVPVLLRVEAPQQGPVVVRVLLVDREVFPVEPALAQATGRVSVEAPQVCPVVQGPPVDRGAFPVARVVAPAVGRPVIQVAAPELALAVVRAPSADRELAPVVPVSALPAALRVVRPEAIVEV
jgi:hypothetical protein